MNEQTNHSETQQSAVAKKIFEKIVNVSTDSIPLIFANQREHQNPHGLGLKNYLEKTTNSAEKSRLNPEGRRHAQQLAIELAQEYGDTYSRKEFLAILRDVYSYSVGENDQENQAFRLLISSIRAHVVFKNRIPVTCFPGESKQYKQERVTDFQVDLAKQLRQLVYRIRLRPGTQSTDQDTALTFIDLVKSADHGLSRFISKIDLLNALYWLDIESFGDTTTLTGIVYDAIAKDKNIKWCTFSSTDQGKIPQLFSLFDEPNPPTLVTPPAAETLAVPQKPTKEATLPPEPARPLLERIAAKVKNSVRFPRLATVMRAALITTSLAGMLGFAKDSHAETVDIKETTHTLVIPSELEIETFTGGSYETVTTPPTNPDNPSQLGSPIEAGEEPDGDPTAPTVVNIDSFSERFRPVDLEHVQQLAENLNITYRSRPLESRPSSVFTALFDERVGIIFSLDENGNYYAKYQFPAGFAQNINHLEFIWARPDSRGVMETPESGIFGGHLINLSLVNYDAKGRTMTEIEIHGNPTNDLVQEVNNSTGCVVLDDQTWEFLSSLETQGELFQEVLILPNAFTNPTDIFDLGEKDGQPFASTPSIRAVDYIENTEAMIPGVVENLVNSGELTHDNTTDFRIFQLARIEWYRGKFDNAAAAALEFNRNIPTTIRPGEEVYLLRDGILTINDEAGYSYSTLGYGSGSCWTVAALDQTLLSARVRTADGSLVPLVLFNEGSRSTHPHDYYTYGGFDEQGNRYASPGATIYMNQTRDRELILEGSKDYGFIINPAVEALGVSGVNIKIVPSNDVIESINVQISLETTNNEVTLDLQTFRSKEEIESTAAQRIISETGTPIVINNESNLPSSTSTNVENPLPQEITAQTPDLIETNFDSTLNSIDLFSNESINEWAKHSAERRSIVQIVNVLTTRGDFSATQIVSFAEQIYRRNLSSFLNGDDPAAVVDLEFEKIANGSAEPLNAEFLTSYSGLVNRIEASGALSNSVSTQIEETLPTVEQEEQLVTSPSNTTQPSLPVNTAESNNLKLIAPQESNFLNWLTTEQGPFPNQELNGEQARFIRMYVENLGVMLPGSDITGRYDEFQAANALWYLAFPTGSVSGQRSDLGQEIMNMRYGNLQSNLATEWQDFFEAHLNVADQTGTTLKTLVATPTALDAAQLSALTEAFGANRVQP